MTKKSVGYVKLIWTCPRCQTRNPGPNKFCNGCGAPQPDNVPFEQPAEAELVRDADEVARAKAGPDIVCPYCGSRNPGGVKFCGACGGDLSKGKARASGGVVGAYHGVSGATRPCPACGTPNPLTALKCSNCGSALAAGQPTSPTPPPPAARGTAPSRAPLLIGGAVGLLCVLAVAVGLLSLRRSEHQAIVDSVNWERAIAIEAMAAVEHSAWEDQVPSDARDLSCDMAYRETQNDPAPIATEVCGTAYTVDQGSGYGEVVQDCVYQVYDQMCSYTVDEWTVVETARRSGHDLHPSWPEVRLAGGQQEGDRSEAYQVVLVADGDRYTYSPATVSDFSAFEVGSRWMVVVNGLGAVVKVEAAP